jgi:uncharacterized protein YdhG (YjbR/CyaY superfamily)
MIKVKQNYQTIDDYIKTFPKDIQEVLQKIRQAIKKAAPGAEEIISYQMPAFKSGRVLVWFGAFKNHIGLFPTAEAITVFKKELGAYKTSKGTIQFPIDKKIPLALISKITKFRLKQVLKNQTKKKK